MSRESSSAAFRAQLLIADQRQLYDYWLERASERVMPRRSDVRPSDFPRLLPHVSLIEVADGPRRYRVRLAGTRLRDIYDREITGLHLDEYEAGASRTYWEAAYERLVETGRPAQGVIRAPNHLKDHLVQFWLRLPLSLAGAETARVILCHDVCVPAVEMSGDGTGEDRGPAALVG